VTYAQAQHRGSVPRVAVAVSALLALLGVIASGPLGCVSDDQRRDLAWLLRQGIGQVEVLAAARPVSALLDDRALPPDLRRRLAVATAARAFARDRLGLNVGQQYRSVVFLDAPAVVYVVSAAAEDSLSPYTWAYPLLGALPYRGSFSLADAEASADALAERGFDVSVRPVTTYSLLGLAPDPLLSSMLYRRDELDIVETVIHELAHATVFEAGQGAFNEGLATFVGREGRRQFIRERFGADSAIARRSDALDDDDDAWSRATAALAFDLRVLYAQRDSLSRAALLDEKTRIFARHQQHWLREVAPTLFSVHMRTARLPANNAELSAVGIYSMKQHLYIEAFDACGRDWRCFLGLLKNVATDAMPEAALARRMPPTAPEVSLP
jgi:predicted aminopeptidase